MRDWPGSYGRLGLGLGAAYGYGVYLFVIRVRVQRPIGFTVESWLLLWSSRALLDWIGGLWDISDQLGHRIDCTLSLAINT
jgi:hypothetical protein